MATSNSNAYLPSALDGSWSIDILKSLVENPCQISNISRTFATFHNDASPEHEFMVKYLQDLYNPPETNFQLSKQKLKELHSMGIKDRHSPNFLVKNGIKKVDMVWKGDPEPPMVQIMNRAPMRSNFFPFSNYPYPYRSMDKVVNQKRELNINQIYDSTGKKIKGQRAIGIKNPIKATNVIDLDADDSEVISLARKPKKINRPIQYRHITRTGLKLPKPTSKIPIEIIDSPMSEELNENLTLSENKERIQEDEKDGDRETTTNATNMTNIDETNDIGTSKEGTIDFCNFDGDDFGIKILGEVFLCGRCQKQISQRDVDKGHKEMCLSCSKIKDKPSRSSGNRRIQTFNIPSVVNEESLKLEQESTLNIDRSKNMQENIDKYDILGPIYRSRGYYEESSLTNILDSAQNSKHIPLGKNYQAISLPLALYNKEKKRTRKLWKPDRIDIVTYEKFKNDVNGKNSLYLLDEEITEILVRHRYNVEQALSWSIKSNPEFQYYVKRSSNRRRIITRGAGKNYYAE